MIRIWIFLGLTTLALTPVIVAKRKMSTRQKSEDDAIDIENYN